MEKKVFLEETTESKVFTVDATGKRYGFSKLSETINGKKHIIAQWKVDGNVVLEIRTALPGMWRILRDGRKGYEFVPETPSEKQWVVLLVQ